MYRPTDERNVERTSAQSPMASLIESIDHRLDGRVLDRAIKREVEDYDEGAENVFTVGNGPNIEAPTRNNHGGDSDSDVEAHDYNESGLAYGADPDSIPTSALQRMAGEFRADRFLNIESMSDDGEDCDGDWNASNYSQANKKQNDVVAVADQYSNVYSLKGFIENDSVEEVLHLIYSDERRGLLKFSYRMWALHRLGINPLKEVTCRLNWSQVVPNCLQRNIVEDGRIKNSLRKYISNYIYNCRQTVVVRENRDELNRIKAQGLSKDRLRKAIAQLVNKTSNKHGWTLYRPIPSYIMRNISGVRNKAYKEKRQKEQALSGDETVANIEQPVEQPPVTENTETPIVSEISRAAINSMMKRVFVRGLNSALRDSYREEAIANLGITDWLSVNVADVDYTPVIPEVLRADAVVTRKVQTRLSGYVTLCVRKARTKKMLEKYADEMLQIRENYARENAPEELFIELIKKASEEYGWDGHIPSAVGLKGWIYDRTVDFFKSKLAGATASNGESRWEDKDVSLTDSQGTPEADQTIEERVPSCYIELENYQSAMREVFDSKRHIRSSFRQYAFDALNISATMKGDPSTVDFSSVIPTAIQQQPATMRRIAQQLAWSASAKVLGQRRALVMQKNAAQMANIRRQYPSSKDVPRDLIKDIIDKTYAEEGWGEHKPAVEPFISKLYEYSIAYVDKLGECNLEDIAESEEASCSKSVNGSVQDDDGGAFSDISPARRSGDALQLRRSERNVHKRSIEENDTSGFEAKKKMSTNAIRQGYDDMNEFEGHQSSAQINGQLETTIKELFERDLKGPLNSSFRKKVVEELGITMSFAGILEDLDYSSLIPTAIQSNDQIHDQVRQQIISYLIGFIRRCRLTYIAEEKATRLAELLKDYPKHNSIPLNTLYALIHEVAREKGWKRYLPLASKLKYRIYERRELIMKRAAAQKTQQDVAGPSATAIVATGYAVTPLQAAAIRNKRNSFGLLHEMKGDKRLFLTSGGEESEVVTSSSTVFPISATSSSRRSSIESTSGNFMQTMKNKLKDLGPEEMSALMNRINEHVRDKMLAQLTSQIVHNFDATQQDSVFSEILGIVDAHKTGSP